MLNVSGIVEVCPECDIADCKHIRAKKEIGVDARNEMFKFIMKAATPINRLIGAARSADSLTKDSNMDAWAESLIKRAEEAAIGMDSIVDYLDKLTMDKPAVVSSAPVPPPPPTDY